MFGDVGYPCPECGHTKRRLPRLLSWLNRSCTAVADEDTTEWPEPCGCPHVYHRAA